MSRIFQPLLFVLAKCARNELIHHIEFLKTENQILRSRLAKQQLRLQPSERRLLLKLGAAIGCKVKHLITIVRYETYLQ